MDSLVWMRVKIWSTMPILAPSAGTKLPMCARNTIRPTCIEQEYYQYSRKFSQGKSTLLYPHYLCCINSFSSPAHVSLGPILVLSPLRCDIMLWMFQTADLHDDHFTYTAKQLNDVTSLKDTECLSSRCYILLASSPQAPPRLYLTAMEKKSGEGPGSKLRNGPEMVDSVST